MEIIHGVPFFVYKETIFCLGNLLSIFMHCFSYNMFPLFPKISNVYICVNMQQYILTSIKYTVVVLIFIFMSFEIPCVPVAVNQSNKYCIMIAH